METKEVKIQAPEGYEIDKENSTFECVKFKPLKKDITYQNVGEKIFSNNVFYINYKGEIEYYNQKDYPEDYDGHYYDKNNATNRKQLEKLLALNQLLNIAEYYNSRNRIIKSSNMYIISYSTFMDEYQVCGNSSKVIFGVEVCFNNKEDAQAVIDNPNFREILDTIYK